MKKHKFVIEMVIAFCVTTVLVLMLFHFVFCWNPFEERWNNNRIYISIQANKYNDTTYYIVDKNTGCFSGNYKTLEQAQTEVLKLKQYYIDKDKKEYEEIGVIK
jgi:hypothetical protein